MKVGFNTFVTIMRKVLLYLFFFSIMGKTFSQLQEDKVLHFLGGNLFGLVGAGVANQISDGDRTWTFVGSIGGSLLIGLAKESIDKSQYDGWDNNDLLATVLGGVAVGVSIDIFKQRKKRKREQLFKDAVGHKLLIKPQVFSESEKYSLNLLGISSSVLNKP
ncbi:MAG: hypothetical protein WBB27_08615 [Maribacter sp.]